MDVKFLTGLFSAYDALETKDQGTFYLTKPDESSKPNRFFLGELELTGAAVIEELTKEIGKLTELKTTEKNTLVGAINEISDAIGSLEDLTTTEQTNLVGAINELKKSIDEIKTAEAVTVENTTASAEGLYKQYTIKQGGNAVKETIDIEEIKLEEGTGADIAKKYTLKQGDKTIGSIDIPKDLVVESGELIVVSDSGTSEGTELENGTYIKLVLNDTEKSKIYINVSKLIDTYTANNTEKDIEISIVDYKISANIADGKVTSTKIADNAVTEGKINDGAVTEGKIADNAVVEAKINKGAVTGDKIADGVVVIKKLGTDVIGRFTAIEDILTWQEIPSA